MRRADDLRSTLRRCRKGGHFRLPTPLLTANLAPVAMDTLGEENLPVGPRTSSPGQAGS